MNQDQFLSLPPLPGGTDHYLETMTTMLHYLNHAILRTRDEFADWFVTEFQVARSRINPCVQTLTRLELVERQPQRRLSITARGADFLDAHTPEAQARLILEILLEHYAAAAEILIRVEQSETPTTIEEITADWVQTYPQWSSGEGISMRLYWLSALGCIQQTGYRRHYQITAFGKEITTEYLSSVSNEQAIAPVTEADRLIHHARQSARDTDHPGQFERAIGDVFEFFGFLVEHRGQPGETDLWVYAPLGHEGYSFIVDTKARHDGKLHQVDFMPIRRHQESANADFAVVVAEQIMGHKIEQYATDDQVIVMPLDLLESWIRFHEHTPIMLLHYRLLFQEGGILRELPHELLGIANMQQRRFLLLFRVVELLQHAHQIGLDIQWSVEQIHSNLAMAYHVERYMLAEVADVIGLLSNPVIGGVKNTPHGLVLGLDQKRLSHLLQVVAQSLEGNIASN